MKRRIHLGIMMMASMLLASGGVAQELDPERVHWSLVTMKAKKLGFSTSSDIAFSLIPVAEGKKDFLEADPKGVYPEPAGDRLALMKVTSGFLGRDSDTRFWFAPESALVYQRELLEVGKRNRYKAYRFTQDGAWEYRKNPIQGEENKPPEAWTNIRSELDSYPGWPADKPVTESAGLFYIVSASSLEKAGDRVEAHVVSKENVYAIDIEVVGTEDLKVDYSRKRGGKADKVKGSVKALHLTMTPIPPEGADPKNFQLLGLEGDVDLWIDIKDRYPLQVEGKVPVAGNVKIRLQSVEL